MIVRVVELTIILPLFMLAAVCRAAARTVIVRTIIMTGWMATTT